MKIDIHELLIDDDNTDKMHAHGVSVAIAFELLDGLPRALPNHVEGGAPYLLVGPTSMGFVSLPMDPTSEYGLYRPRTGYPSKLADVRAYERVGPTG